MRKRRKDYESISVYVLLLGGMDVIRTSEVEEEIEGDFGEWDPLG